MSGENVDAALREKLEKLLLYSLASGEPIEADEAYWEQKRARLLAKHNVK